MQWDVFKNRNVPLTWTNQTSAQTSASNTLTIISPSAPVSEMERSGATLISLLSVLISSVSGIVVELRVKPGDDVIIYGDCEWKDGFKIVWLRKASHEHQPPLIYLPEDLMHPHYTLVRNNANRTFDLLLKNVTDSDLGLYYCVLHNKDKSEDRFRKEGCHYGSRTAFLSFLDTTLPCADFPQTTPISICWKLLAGDDDMIYASLDIPSSRQKRLRNAGTESSDLCTYSEVQVETT
ncbi:hypothetical protein AOLI_G00198550 [Acnodon oligacanthus]